MKKPDKENLYESGISESAEKVINKAFASTDLSSALKQLASLLMGGKIILRCEAVKYSSSNGKPIRYGWVPYEEWDGKIWFDSFFKKTFSLNEDDPLYKPLLNFLPEGKTTVVEVGKEKFVIMHVPTEHQSGGTIPNHLKFLKTI